MKRLGWLVVLIALLPVSVASQSGWVTQNNAQQYITRNANSAYAVTITQQNTSACTLKLVSGSTTAFSVCGTSVTTANVVLVPNGTVGAPAFAPSAQPTTGWYFVTGAIRGSIAGSAKLSLEAGTLAISSTQSFAWSSSGEATGTADTSFTRSGIGAVTLLGASAGDTGVFKAKTHQASAGTFSTCNASPVEGMLCAITDSSTATWGATITGSGANHVLGYYNGTNWTVAAK